MEGRLRGLVGGGEDILEVRVVWWIGNDRLGVGSVGDNGG